MASRLNSFEDMPEEDYVAAFGELIILCDLSSAIQAKKAEKWGDAKSIASAHIIRQNSNSGAAGECERYQPPARYVRKSKSNLFETENS
jgi:hypothetical protein